MMPRRCGPSRAVSCACFLVGLLVGLSAVRQLAHPCPPWPPEQPVSEEPPAPPPPPPPVAAESRGPARPRYYSTELGIRAPLMVAVLLPQRCPPTLLSAHNQTSSALPIIKYFSSSPLPGTVTFTDPREVLRPFRVIKYLADNYLEEYDRFFLVGGETFLNPRRLQELARSISLSQDLYMGQAVDNGDFCSLDHGIMLSNSVLRSMHSSLDWCVRNSYSAHHHENLGRCVMHTTSLKCTPTAQDEKFVSLSITGEERSWSGIERAASVHPARDAYTLLLLHTHLAAALILRAEDRLRSLETTVDELVPHMPPGFQNRSWPVGLRGDAGMLPPPPDTRFDHLRWSMFNETHTWMPDDTTDVAQLEGVHLEAAEWVLTRVVEWAVEKWGRGVAEVADALWSWDPPRGVHYSLSVQLEGGGDGSWDDWRFVEGYRALGPARLLSVPYVTESGRVRVLLPVRRDAREEEVLSWLRRYEDVALKTDRRADLAVIVPEGANTTTVETAYRVVAEMQSRYRDSVVEVWVLGEGHGASRLLQAAAGRLPRDKAVLLAHHLVDFNQDFLNRVRMNTIPGHQWFSPLPFSQFSMTLHPLFRDPSGARPTVNTGQFDLHHQHIASFHRGDLEAALANLTDDHLDRLTPGDLLLRSGVRVLRAPEPGLVARPPRAPCPAPPAGLSCLQTLRTNDFHGLHLGARIPLAKLLLEARLGEGIV